MYGSRSAAHTPSGAPSVGVRCSVSGGAPQAGHTFVKSGRGVPQSGHSDSVTAPPLMSLPGSGAAPSRAVPPGVYVGEWTVAAAGLVDPDPADERGLLRLDLLHRAREPLRDGGVDPAVAGDVVRGSIAVVVDVNVRPVPVHVAAQVRAALGVASAGVVPRRAEPAHDVDVLDAHAVRLQLLDGELELVEQVLVEQQVLRPDVLLVLGQELPEREVLGRVGVLVLAGDLDEPGGVRVLLRARLPPVLVRPAAEIVQADLVLLLLAEGNE